MFGHVHPSFLDYGAILKVGLVKPVVRYEGKGAEAGCSFADSRMQLAEWLRSCYGG